MERALVSSAWIALLGSSYQNLRPKVMDQRKVSIARTLLAGGAHPKEVAETLGIGLATLYRYLPKAA